MNVGALGRRQRQLHHPASNLASQALIDWFKATALREAQRLHARSLRDSPEPPLAACERLVFAFKMAFSLISIEWNELAAISERWHIRRFVPDE